MPKPWAPLASARKLVAESRAAAKRMRAAARNEGGAKRAGLLRAAEIYEAVARDKAREVRRV